MRIAGQVGVTGRSQSEPVRDAQARLIRIGQEVEDERQFNVPTLFSCGTGEEPAAGTAETIER
jgi:hypothetical protein